MKKSNKFFNWLKSFPTIISLCIIIPSLVALTRYAFSIDYYYHNFYYDGEELFVDDATFEITGIEKVANVTQLSTTYSYQGGACYEDYYAVCLDSFESILFYDTRTMKLSHTVKTGTYNTTWHCNQMFFGPDFYKTRDKYPLLYVSMENINVHATMVFRIYQQAGEYYSELVQQITLSFSSEEDIIYYPNSYYDYEDGYLYYGGYTENTFMKTDTNKLKYYRFDLPDYRDEEEILETADADYVFEIPSETATQGGFISHHHLYETFAFGSKTDPLRTPKMRVVDLENGKIIKDYQNLGEQFGAYEEFEHVAISKSGKLISLGNPLYIYEFKYTSKS